MRYPLTILAVVWVLAAGCGKTLDLPGHDLTAGQPQVIAVSPEPDGEAEVAEPVVIEFSAPIEEASLLNEGLVLVTEEALVQPRPAEGPAFMAALQKSPLPPVSGRWTLSPSRRVLIFTPAPPFSLNKTYSVVVSPGLMGEDHLPFNQTPGEGPTPFVASFRVTGGGGTAVNRGRPPQPASETPASESNAGETAAVGDTEDESVPGTTTEASDATADAPLPTVVTEPPQEPAAELTHKVVINEIYYDALTSDTDGLLFVELHGTPGDPIGGYKIVFLNGDNGAASESIVLPDDARIGDDGLYLIADSRTSDLLATQVSGAAMIDNFDPQNGPDAVQLLNAGEELLDAVGYGPVPTAKSEAGLSLWEGSPAPDVSAGHSLSRRSPGLDTDDNAADFIDLPVPTPGIL